MKELQLFTNEEFGEIRGVEIEGKSYVVASDVAKALGYKRPNDAISQHCKYTVKHRIPHPQNINKTLEVNLIPEGDIYRLIIRSKLPSAQKFEEWVMDEVLPQIRRTGEYRPAPKLDNKPLPSYQIEDPIARAERWIEEEKVRKGLADANKILTQYKIKGNKLTDVASATKKSVPVIKQWLYDHDWIYSVNGITQTNEPDLIEVHTRGKRVELRFTKKGLARIIDALQGNKKQKLLFNPVENNL